MHNSLQTMWSHRVAWGCSCVRAMLHSSLTSRETFPHNLSHEKLKPDPILRHLLRDHFIRSVSKEKLMAWSFREEPCKTLIGQCLKLTIRRTHILVKTQVQQRQIVVVIRRRQKGRDPGVIAPHFDLNRDQLSFPPNPRSLQLASGPITNHLLSIRSNVQLHNL